MVEIADCIRDEICKSINQKAAGGRFIIYDRSTNLIITLYDIQLPAPAFSRITKGSMDLQLPSNQSLLAVDKGTMTHWEIRSSIKNTLYPNKPVLVGTIGTEASNEYYDIVVNSTLVNKNERLSIEQLRYIAPR